MQYLRDELHDISGGSLAVITQQLVVAIELRHLTEVRGSHSDDDDGERVGRGLDDGCLGVVEVVDHTVSDD